MAGAPHSLVSTMSHISTTTVNGSLLAATTILIAGYYSQISPQHTSRSPLWVEPSELDFGLCPLVSTKTIPFTIRNSGDREITISDFITSCGCSRVSPTPVVIPAHGTATVAASLDVISPGEWPISKRMSVSIVPVVATLTSPPSWKVHGSFWSPITSPRPIQGLVPFQIEGKIDSRSTELFVTLAPQISGMKVDATSDALHILDNSWQDASMHRWSIKLQVNSDATPGEYHNALTVLPEAFDGTAFPSLSLPITVVVLSDLYISPHEHHFGATDVGRRLHHEVVVASRNNFPFTIDAIHIIGDEDIRTECRRSDAGTTTLHHFDISLTANAIGEHVVDILFSARYLTEFVAPSTRSLLCRIRYVGTADQTSKPNVAMR